MPAKQARRSTIRVRFSKFGKIRFTSHRDVARIWERALRRAELPIAYTEGFSPRPKLSFGLALSTAYESHGEYLDVALREEGTGEIDVGGLPARLAPALPEGIEVQAVVDLPAGADSLQQAVTSCTWHIEVEVGRSTVGAGLDRALAASELVVSRVRKGHTVVDDVRPAILAAHVVGTVVGAVAGPVVGTVVGTKSGTTGTVIEAELATQPRGLRPAELIAALDPTWDLARVIRINQWTQVGGARREVIDLPSAATPPPHAKARAS
ncbi:MAG: TIGR03936 family radical SAM-associated protein [Acidimicrobiales bacterium]